MNWTVVLAIIGTRSPEGTQKIWVKRIIMTCKDTLCNAVLSAQQDFWESTDPVECADMLQPLIFLWSTELTVTLSPFTLSPPTHVQDQDQVQEPRHRTKTKMKNQMLTGFGCLKTGAGMNGFTKNKKIICIPDGPSYACYDFESYYTLNLITTGIRATALNRTGWYRNGKHKIKKEPVWGYIPWAASKLATARRSYGT